MRSASSALRSASSAFLAASRPRGRRAGRRGRPVARRAIRTRPGRSSICAAIEVILTLTWLRSALMPRSWPAVSRMSADSPACRAARWATRAFWAATSFLSRAWRARASLSSSPWTPGGAGRADHPEEEREEEEEGSEAAAEATAPGGRPGSRGPAAHGRADPVVRRAAHLLGDVIVRANSVGRPRVPRAWCVVRRGPPVDRRPEWALTRDDTGSWAFYSASPDRPPAAGEAVGRRAHGATAAQHRQRPRTLPR